MMLIAVFCFERSSAQTGILVIPKRVIFEGNKRTQELNIGNAGSDSANYLVNIIEMKMRTDGSFEEIHQADSGQQFASSHLRIFPRHISLAPNEAQTIKLQLFNVSKMAPGEYRSHIYFRPAPKPRPKDAPRLEKMVTNLTVKLIPRFGVTIPVIVRIGENTTRLEFADLALKINTDTIPTVTGRIKRTGNMSVYGNVSVEHVSTEGVNTHLGIARGLAVYSPNVDRKFVLELDKSRKIDYNNGKLKVTFSTQVEDRLVKIAEAEIVLRR